MSCTPAQPCGVIPPRLAIDPPPPALPYLTRRLGRYDDFLADLVAAIESLPVPGAPAGARLLGDRWDILADPPARLIAQMWALVADSVCTYSELTANESYLGSAHDWTDLRRIAVLVGYAPRPRVAAHGWVEVDIDPGTNPTVPAGTRVQAPALPPDRPKSQPFETIDDTTLAADWAGLTATWVPQPADPTGRFVRFLGDPGFGAGDRVLFVLEKPPVPPLTAGYDWFAFWFWLVSLFTLTQPPSSTPLAVAKVRKRHARARHDDRRLRPRPRHDPRRAGPALRRLPDHRDRGLGAPPDQGAQRQRHDGQHDRRLERHLLHDAEPHQRDFDLGVGRARRRARRTLRRTAGRDRRLGAAGGAACDIVRIDAHSIVRWEAAPGSPTRVSKLSFSVAVGTLASAAGDVTVHVLDRREIARHYEFPDAPPDPSHAQLRLYPAPAKPPSCSRST